MKLFNTLTREKQDFTPLDDNEVTLYTCGPTVYDWQHIGNLRSYIFADLLIRTLLLNGFKVNHVINITDIGHLTSDADVGEDKMMKALKREGLEPSIEAMKTLATKYTEAFKNDIKELNVFQMKDPNYKITWTKATDYVEQMIELTKTLVEKGNAYETEQAIYFDVTTFKDYTKLSKQNLEDKLVAVRQEVEVDTNKKHAADFALWFKKAGKHSEHLMNWNSPWGDGFPGWHIECSAMAMEVLGQSIDIHTGGVDHISVHHTNEIAQSEAATGKPFAQFWMHGEFLDLNKAKMSKSDGTFITLADLKDKGFDPLAYRYFCLGTHYRQKLNFSYEALEGAQNALNKLNREIKTYDEPKVGCAEYEERFGDVLADDLNSPQALALMWELVKDPEFPSSARLQSLFAFDKVLGLSMKEKFAETVAIPENVQALITKRDIARAQQQWGDSDLIRDKLEELGWIVEDSSEGTTVSKK